MCAHLCSHRTRVLHYWAKTAFKIQILQTFCIPKERASNMWLQVRQNAYKNKIKSMMQFKEKDKNTMAKNVFGFEETNEQSGYDMTLIIQNVSWGTLLFSHLSMSEIVSWVFLSDDHTKSLLMLAHNYHTNTKHASGKFKLSLRWYKRQKFSQKLCQWMIIKQTFSARVNWPKLAINKKNHSNR